MDRTIAIVGAGFSGTLVAIHLLRSAAPRGSELLLLERTGRFAEGVAYGTRRGSHLLNVPAARMSAFEDAPHDFLEFMRARDPGVSGGTFVPRTLYGLYLAERLAQAQQRGVERGVVLRRMAQHVTGIRRGLEREFVLMTESGWTLEATHVVLALGNFQPAPLFPEAAARSWYVPDPWARGALEGLPDGPALLVGTGLTMIDVALTISETNARVRMLGLSRHGLSAQAHRIPSAPPPARARLRGLDAWPRTALGFLRAVRREVREAAGRGVDWRDVISALRGDTAALWQSLPLDERRRFLAHLRPYWEIHRHRTAPASAASVAELVASGRLELRAGRILGTTPVIGPQEGEGGREWVEVRMRPRGTERIEVLRVARVVNCTGPQTDLRRIGEPLVRALLAQDLVRPDALGLGIDCDDEGAVLDAAGHPSRRLFAAGPLCKARTYEQIAVPELRGAAERLARRLGRELVAAGARATRETWSYG